MVRLDTHNILILKKALLGGLFSLVVLSSGCGDDGGEGGGFGGTGGTLGGLGTTSILYVANSGSDNVSGYSINATSGICSDSRLSVLECLRPFRHGRVLQWIFRLCDER